MKHKQADLLNRAAAEFARMLKDIFGKRILGPEYPMVSRIMNYYIKHILMKIERDTSVQKMKQRLVETEIEFRKLDEYRPVRILMDVDPQ
jgi:primosomal protein N' (replication factor Y)